MQVVRMQFTDAPKVFVEVNLADFPKYCELMGIEFEECWPAIAYDYILTDKEGDQIATGAIVD